MRNLAIVFDKDYEMIAFGKSKLPIFHKRTKQEARRGKKKERKSAPQHVEQEGGRLELSFVGLIRKISNFLQLQPSIFIYPLKFNIGSVQCIGFSQKFDRSKMAVVSGHVRRFSHFRLLMAFPAITAGKKRKLSKIICERKLLLLDHILKAQSIFLGCSL